jgi:curved DNA-binding protein CbpA
MTSVFADYYALLGIPVTATTEDILAADRRAALQYHVDKPPTDLKASAAFIPYRDAKAYLTQPDARVCYDRVRAEYRNWELTVMYSGKGIPPRPRQIDPNASTQSDRKETRSYQFDSNVNRVKKSRTEKGSVTWRR